MKTLIQTEHKENEHPRLGEVKRGCILVYQFYITIYKKSLNLFILGYTVIKNLGKTM